LIPAKVLTENGDNHGKNDEISNAQTVFGSRHKNAKGCFYVQRVGRELLNFIG